MYAGFNSNQSELIKDLIRELLKDSDCAVYALNHIKPSSRGTPNGVTPPSSVARETDGVFLRIRPGVHDAIIVSPMSAKARENLIPVAKIPGSGT